MVSSVRSLIKYPIVPDDVCPCYFCVSGGNKGVSALIPPYSTIAPSLQPNTSVSSLSETPIEPIDEAKQVGSESTGEISQGNYFREEQGIELHLTFHIKGRKHSLRMHEFESIPLEICFFKEVVNTLTSGVTPFGLICLIL